VPADWGSDTPVFVLGSPVSFRLDLHADAFGHVHTTDPICLEPHITVRQAFQRMNDQRRGAVLVCRRGVLAGIFTERDALTLMASDADLDIPIEQVMTTSPTSLSERDTVATAIGKMSKGGYRRLPIVDAGGRPTGVLTVKSILHFLVDHFPATVFNLPPTPHHTTESREGA
jgi:CBS domain-containing protein